MNPAVSSARPAVDVSWGYRLLRGILRTWFAVVFRKIRLLNSEVLPATGATMLVVSHPPSFLDALLLVTAFERQIHCLLERKHLRGPARGSIGWGLGMIPFNSDGGDWSGALDACSKVFARRKAVLVFADLGRDRAGERKPVAERAATLALDAEIRHSGQLGLALFPVDLFLPIARSYASELLIYVDGPCYAQEFLPRTGSDLLDRTREFANALEEQCRENAFRLRPEDIKLFLSDLEEVLRRDLEEEWASRPRWKQKVEGFELSEFVVEWLEQLNWLNPGRLVALRESLEAYREAQRRLSLLESEIETAPGWWRAPLRRASLFFCSLRVPAHKAELRRMRKHILEDLNTARNAYADALKVVH